jgi:hypothetical protein
MTTVVCVPLYSEGFSFKVDWPRGHAHYVSKWTGGSAAGTGGPVAGTGSRSTGHPATGPGRPVDRPGCRLGRR